MTSQAQQQAPAADKAPPPAHKAETPAPALAADMFCQSCGYWKWTKDETQKDGTILHFGKCIIHAPSPASPPYQRATWPITEGLDACGEHAPVAAVTARHPATPPKAKEPEPPKDHSDQKQKEAH